MPTVLEAITALFPLHVQRIVECMYDPATSEWDTETEDERSDKVASFLASERFVLDDVDLLLAFHADKTTEGGRYWEALKKPVRDAEAVTFDVRFAAECARFDAEVAA